MSFNQTHRPITRENRVANVLRLFNEHVQGTAAYIWAVAPQGDVSFYHKNEIPENTLFVFVSTNYSYYHQIEIVFHQVAHFETFPEIWRPHPDKEALTFETTGQDFRFCFNDDENNKWYINAPAISIYNGTVYYYQRPQLKPDEKIALFVK